MSAALLLSLALQATAPPAALSPPPPAPAQAEREREARLTLFLFYRLSFFHDVAALQQCGRVDPDRTRALDGRYDALHRRLVERFGAARVDVPDTSPLERGNDPDCGMRIILSGYDNALKELEMQLAGTRR